MFKQSRRQFIAAAATTVAAPAFIPASALGKDGAVAPSERITVGAIGVGWQGAGNLGQFLNLDACQVVAVCDIDKNHLEGARKKVNGKYKNEDCKTYHDFRELLARTDIDAVSIGTPDHWHAIPAIAAANAGKDIFSEKPLAKTLAEGRAIVQAVEKNNRIWQTGSWQRSVFNFRQGVELVRNGYIGTVREVQVGLPSGHSDFAKTGKDKPNSDPPAQLDYEFWIGPASMMPYNVCRTHKNWRWNYNTGGGQLMDWIGHHNDIAHWGLGNDDTLGPLEITPIQVDFPSPDALWNTATKYRFECLYPNNVKFTIAGGHSDIQGGTKWIGDNGWVYVSRGKFETSDPQWQKEIAAKEKSGDLKVLLHAPANHFANFLDCVKSRKPTLTPAQVAHRSASTGHLGHIALLTGKKLTWDAKTEQITNEKDLNKLLHTPYRTPWKL
jgi:predicted dehydrogenase